jgi:nicotinate-nucleotide adenylyltransferase
VGERIGILGGTFDPPHLGHLALAYDALEQMAIDRVLLIPAARQPLKATVEMSSAEDRVAMSAHLAALDPRIVVDRVEVDRGGLSFMVDTVRTLRARHPQAQFVLVMGEDTAATLPQWKEPEALAALVQVAIAVRGEEPSRNARSLPRGFDARWLTARRIDLSASELRSRVRAGQTIRGLVPDAVADHIATHGLYRPLTQ